MKKNRIIHTILGVISALGILSTLGGCSKSDTNKISKLDKEAQTNAPLKTQLQYVVELLTNLDENTSKEEVEQARYEYNQLEDSEKEKIAQILISKLIEAEKRIENINKVTFVQNLIDNLGENPSKEELEAARNAYNELSDEQKVQVTGFYILFNQEVVFERKQIAKEFENKVNALPTSPTVKQIFDLMLEYDDLDEEVKPYISNEIVDKLNYLYESKKEIIDQTQAVVIQINLLNDFSRKNEIISARNAYNSLPDEGKELIDQRVIDSLVNLETRFLIIEEAARTIDDKISLINEDKLNDLATLTSLANTKSSISEIFVLVESFIANYGQDNFNDLISQNEKLELLERYNRTFIAYGSSLNDGFSSSGCDGGYSLPDVVSKENDSTYGELFTCTLVEGNKHIEMRIANDADFTDFTKCDYYYFYFYNPTSNTFPLSISAQSNWAGKLFEKTIVPGWNKIEFGANYASKIRFLCTTLSSKTSVSDVSGTWKMSKFYGSSMTADVYADVNPVLKAINELTNTSPEETVVSARNQYEALNAEQRGFITNLNKLEEQEERIHREKIGERAKSIVDQIDILPASINNDEDVVCALGILNNINAELEVFIADYGESAVETYITNYLKYDAIKTLCAGYNLVYGANTNDGFGKEGCDGGYSRPNDPHRNYDSTYGIIFETELEEGNGFLEFRIMNDAKLNKFDIYSRYYFYFYNPTDNTFSMAFSSQSNWAGKEFEKSIIPGWNKIEIEESESINLRFLNTTLSSVKLNNCAGNWKMSMIVGQAKA